MRNGVDVAWKERTSAASLDTVERCWSMSKNVIYIIYGCVLERGVALGGEDGRLALSILYHQARLAGKKVQMLPVSAWPQPSPHGCSAPPTMVSSSHLLSFGTKMNSLFHVSKLLVFYPQLHSLEEMYDVDRSRLRSSVFGKVGTGLHPLTYPCHSHLLFRFQFFCNMHQTSESYQFQYISIERLEVRAGRLWN